MFIITIVRDWRVVATPTVAAGLRRTVSGGRSPAQALLTFSGLKNGCLEESFRVNLWHIE